MALTLPFVFLAGILSFFSPCVVPLVPGFLAYLAGVNRGELDGRGFNRTIFLNTVFYVLGFTLVFTALGLLLNSALAVATIGVRVWITRVGAIVIILFGLFLTGLLRIPWLETEHTMRIDRKASYLTSFLFGVTFAVGWTPCVGAVLGGIFALAATGVTNALLLMLTYSVGLALPFLLVGVFYSAAARFIKLSAKYTRAVSLVLGVLLIILGVLILFNRLTIFGGIPWFSQYV